MGIALMFLLALYQMQSAIYSEIIEAPSYNENALQDLDQLNPKLSISDSDLLSDLLNEKPEQTELEFRYPISAIGIDYAKNSVVLRFQKNGRKPSFKNDPDYELKRKSVQDNFMRFGKRQPEHLPRTLASGYFDEMKRDPKQDFMRFGRSPSDFMRFGRTPSDFMRFGRDPGQDFMRFGRSDNFMRFGRNLNYHEELRSPKQDFMRFGRPDNFMRFGRSAPNDFERYGKMDSNFMRFGKSVDRSGAGTGTTSEATPNKAEQSKLSSAELKEQPHQETNSVDKAITMLFDKQQGQSQGHGEGQRQQLKSSEQAESEEQFYGP